MNKHNLFGIFILLSCTLLHSQTPRVTISTAERDDYTRTARLKEVDQKKGNKFVFTRGLEILTDIEYVEVYLSDKQVGRTPYENNSIEIGYYRIKLVKTGREDLILWVNIKKDSRTTIDVRYLPEKTGERTEESRKSTIRSGPVYKNLNPDDPLYYNRILFTPSLFQGKRGDLILTDSENYPLITLTPRTPYSLEDDFYLYYWEGNDIDGNASPDGEFSLYAVSNLDLNTSFKVDRRFSRKGSSYFSGFSGLSLVPTAQPLFPGSLQVGSSVRSSFSLSDSSESLYMPYTFFIRYSPLSSWETAFSGEITVFEDDRTPLIAVNTSQKVLLGTNGPVLFSLNGRFAYRGDFNDFNTPEYNRIVRDPAGASLALPVQLKMLLWDFYFAPELQYSFEPVLSSSQSGSDLTAVVRWGISYSDRIFNAGFSSALYSGTMKGLPVLMQTAGDVMLYLPGAPLYLHFNIVYQEVYEGSEDLTLGLGFGFLL